MIATCMTLRCAWAVLNPSSSVTVATNVAVSVILYCKIQMKWEGPQVTVKIATACTTVTVLVAIGLQNVVHLHVTRKYKFSISRISIRHPPSFYRCFYTHVPNFPWPLCQQLMLRVHESNKIILFMLDPRLFESINITLKRQEKNSRILFSRDARAECHTHGSLMLLRP